MTLHVRTEYVNGVLASVMASGALLCLYDVRDTASSFADTAEARSDPARQETVADAIAMSDTRVRGWGGSGGLHVVDVGSGRILATRRTHEVFNPASTAKLATAAVALRHLGAEPGSSPGSTEALPARHRVVEAIAREVWPHAR